MSESLPAREENSFTSPHANPEIAESQFRRLGAAESSFSLYISKIFLRDTHSKYYKR